MALLGLREGHPSLTHLRYIESQVDLASLSHNPYACVSEECSHG